MARRIDPSLIPPKPTLEYEQALWGQGVNLIAGIDEAGRGALAGPVYAAAVVLDPERQPIKKLHGVRDSKEMSASEREYWSVEIELESLASGVGFASAEEIDWLGIVPATRLAAGRALKAMNCAAEHLLVDALVLHEQPSPQTCLLKGDARSLSIAAASVLAKVARDRQLVDLDRSYPDYGFARHKGYGTPAHKQAIASSGPCPEHRLSFAPLRAE